MRFGLSATDEARLTFECAEPQSLRYGLPSAMRLGGFLAAVALLETSPMPDVIAPQMGAVALFADGWKAAVEGYFRAGFGALAACAHC